MKKIINKCRSNYHAPTPKFWRKLGDSLLTISTSITGYAIYSNNHYLGYAALVTGVAGKFLTNFFKK